MLAPRPSTAHRWVGAGCTASLRLSDGQPDTGGPYAEEGRELHDLAARVLRGDPIPKGYEAELEDVIGPYVRDVRSIAAGREVHVEKTLSSTYFSHLIFGTPDAAVPDPLHTVIWDLKTGWALVEVFENWQLLMYAAMLPPAETYTLRIVQPRPWHPDGPVRSWRITRAELDGYTARISASLAIIFGGQDYAVVSPACRYCPAVTICPALRDATLAMIDVSRREAIELPDHALAGELAFLRTATDCLSLRATALEAQIEAKIRAGGNVPGASVEQGRGGRRRWREGVDVVALVRMFHGHDIGRIKPVTPEQAIKAGVPKDAVAALAVRPPGAFRVVLGHDRAKRAFGKEENDA